ncbi:MAG: hypothetical protein RJA70_4744, partial [Pseudomonadota bacterium]
MRSMTGFGVGRTPLGRGRLAVEARSLNHRFLEVRVRMPSEATDQAFYVEQLCRERLQRGRYDITVRFEGPAIGQSKLDLERARAAYESLCSLRDQVAPGSEVPISVLAQVPGLFTSDQALDLDELRRALSEALTEAIEKHNE